MSSLGLVADRWRVVTTAVGDACVLGSGGHAEVYLVEDEGRLRNDDGGASAEGDDDSRPPEERPKEKKKKKKRYALKIDKRVQAGCVGTVRHEIEVIRSLEGVPGVVRLAPELEREEEEEEDEDDEKAGDDEGRERSRKRRKRQRRSSTVSGILKDGRSWVVLELLGANLAEASVAAGAVAPRGSGGRRRAAAAAAAAAGEEEEAAEELEASAQTSSSRRSWTEEDVRAAASSMLSALAAMHAAGWVHRDVKPANFALSLPEEEEDEDDDDEEGEEGDDGGNGAEKRSGSKKASTNPSRRWVAIDFGLSRRFLDAGGNVLPPRPPERRKSRDAFAASHAPPSSAPAGGDGDGSSSVVLFRGSTTYASPAAHSGRDASRRDDLWSWVYTVSELVVGTLPWRRRSERGEHFHHCSSSFEEVKAAARERASAGKRAVAAEPGALMAVWEAEGLLPPPRTPGVVVGSGSEQQKQRATGAPPPPPRPECPPALARAARHVASLGFKDAPDYALLAQCAAELPGPMRGRVKRREGAAAEAKEVEGGKEGS